MKFENTTVKVIAWFEIDGTVHPVKFLIKRDDKKEVTVKVHSIIARTIDKYAGNRMVKLVCECSIETDKLLEGVLKYDLETTRWFILSLEKKK